MNLPLPSPANPKGESIPLSVRVPPEMASAMRLIIESSKTPYTTLSDLMRAALQSFILKIQEELDIEPDSLLPPLLALLRQWERQTSRARAHEMLTQAIEGVADDLRIYLETGNLSRLSAELEQLCSDLMKLSDPFWLRQCLNSLFSLNIVQESLERLGNELTGKQTTGAQRTWAALKIPRISERPD